MGKSNQAFVVSCSVSYQSMSTVASQGIQHPGHSAIVFTLFVVMLQSVD